MARQKGFIRVNGSLGGLTFYERNGQNLMRETGGVSAEKIKNDPNFARTRENIQEFTGSAVIGKAMRLGWVVVFDEMADTNATGRILKLCRTVMNKGTGVRGQRAFSPVTNKDLFVGFLLAEDRSLDSMLLAPYSLAVNAARNAVTLTVADFNTANGIHAPAGATHIRLVCACEVLSSYSYNATSKKYEASDVTYNSKNAVAFSAYIPLGGMVGAATTVVATITPAPTMVASSALIACVGIEFYQSINGVQYLLNGKNAMKVVSVF